MKNEIIIIIQRLRIVCEFVGRLYILPNCKNHWNYFVQCMDVNAKKYCKQLTHFIWRFRGKFVHFKQTHSDVNHLKCDLVSDGIYMSYEINI